MAAIPAVGTQSTSRSLALWLIWAVVIVAADQWTKELILRNYQWGEATTITNFFNIVRAHNTGAAFSFLSNAGDGSAGCSPGLAPLPAFSSSGSSTSTPRKSCSALRWPV